jgi:hypothetical protein
MVLRMVLNSTSRSVASSGMVPSFGWVSEATPSRAQA